MIWQQGLMAGQAIATLWHGHDLWDVLIAAPSPAPGQVFAGRITRLMPRQSGAFVDLGGAVGFLPEAAGLREGERVVVAITRPADGDKAAMVTRHPDFPGRHMVHTPTKPGVNLSKKITDADTRAAITAALTGFDGLVIRTHAADVPPDMLRAEAAALSAHAAAMLSNSAMGLLGETASLGARLQSLWPQATHSAGFDAEATEAALRAAAAPRQSVNGGNLIIEATAALVAVDVNTAHSSAETNHAVATALPRLLRLRGLGGIIAIDFAPMPDLRPVLTSLQRALAACPVPTQMHGVGPAGLVELTRRQDRLATQQFHRSLT